MQNLQETQNWAAAVDTSKAQRYAAVAHAVLKQLHRSGPGGVTFTQISRHSGVSRGWLYKYVGRRPQDLVAFTTRQIGSFVIDHGAPQTSLSPEQWLETIERRFENMLKAVLKFPEIPKVYFQLRNMPTPAGESMEEIARMIRDREATELRAIFGLNPAQADSISELLSAVRMGLLFSIAPVALPSHALKRHIQSLPDTAVITLFGQFAHAIAGLRSIAFQPSELETLQLR